MDWAKTTARGDKKHLSFGISCDLYWRFYGSVAPNIRHAIAYINGDPIHRHMYASSGLII